MSQFSPEFVDVRMRGFPMRSRVVDATTWVDSHSAPLPAESPALDRAVGRVLATDVQSGIDVPPFDRAAMDGFALRAVDTDGATTYNPLPLRLIGESKAGEEFPHQVRPGTAVRIATGAPMPVGADAVLPAESTEASDEFVHITETVPPGKHIGSCGEDILAGRTILKASRRLRPQDVGLLASVGLNCIEVIGRPRVRIVITGNEIVHSGQARTAFQVFDANSPTLAGLIARDGGRLERVIFCQDNESNIRDALTCRGADVILVSGGSSVGPDDFAPSLLASLGELSIHGVALRPSSPSGMGRIASTLVFLLPGNPVSCLCAYDFFAGRAVRLLGGRSSEWPYVKRRVVLREKIASAIGRVDYCRVVVEGDSGRPIAVSGASVLSSTTVADGFVLVPEDSEGYPPAAEVTVFLYDSPA